MAKFKTIKSALEVGYKIFSVHYLLDFQEFAVAMYNEQEEKGIHFYCKRLPSYLTTKNFDNLYLETENCGYFKMELSIPK